MPLSGGAVRDSVLHLGQLDSSPDVEVCLQAAEVIAYHPYASAKLSTFGAAIQPVASHTTGRCADEGRQ